MPGAGEGKEEPGLTRVEQQVRFSFKIIESNIITILQEQERLRKEALLVAERERHARYRRQDEEREVVRQRIRDKVDALTYTDAKCNTPHIC